MKFILIALGVVILIWLISLLISLGDRKTKEKRIQQHQAEKRKKEEKENRPDSAPWQS